MDETIPASDNAELESTQQMAVTEDVNSAWIEGKSRIDLFNCKLEVEESRRYILLNGFIICAIR